MGSPVRLKPGLGCYQGIEGDYQQHLRGECWLEKKNEYIRKEKQLFTFFIDRLRDVTLLSLVLVENILFDAACGHSVISELPSTRWMPDMISVTHKKLKLSGQWRGYRYGSPIMILAELGSAKLRIAYRYSYGTDNFVKFLESQKSVRVVPACR